MVSAVTAEFFKTFVSGAPNVNPTGLEYPKRARKTRKKPKLYLMG